MSIAVRILLLVVSLPGLALLAGLMFSIYHDGLDADLDWFSIVFGFISVYLVYLAIVGDKQRDG